MTLKQDSTTASVCTLSLMLVVLLSAPIAVGAEADSEAEDLLASVLNAWRSHETIEASFEQVQLFAGFDEPLESKGVLRILRPRYFDLQFEPPHNQRQVCDGEWVWTYMEEQEQVFKVAIEPDARRGADLLEWALDGSELIGTVHFDTTLGTPARRIDLKPGSNLPLLELRLWAAPEGEDRLIGYEAVDTEGNRTRMMLVEVSHGLDLKPEDFRFTVPEDVEVIDFGGEATR